MGSHIENDGLDLSSRAKSQGKGVILLDPGESNDGEEDEVGNDLKLNVTWVGAEVSTGKSPLEARTTPRSSTYRSTTRRRCSSTRRLIRSPRCRPWTWCRARRRNLTSSPGSSQTHPLVLQVG